MIPRLFPVVLSAECPARVFALAALMLWIPESPSAQGADFKRNTAQNERVAELVHQLRYQPPHYGTDAIPSVVDQLRQVGPSAAPQLIDALRCTSYQSHYVRENCALLLGEIGDKRAIGPLIGMLPVRFPPSEASRALVRFKSHAVPQLLAAVVEPGPSRVAAIRVLGEIRDRRATLPLLTILANGRYHDRIAAAHALGKIGDPRAFQPLVDAIGSVPRGAVVGLGWLGDKRATPHILDAIKTVKRYPDNGRFDHRAFTALGRLRDPRATAMLIKCVKDVKQADREDAVWALGELGDESAVGPLLEIKRKLRRSWRVIVEEPGADSGLGPGGVSAPDTFPDSVSDALTKLASRHPQPFVAALDQADRDLRVVALVALSPTDAPQAIPRIIAALDRDETYAVDCATQANANRPEPRLVEPLIRYLGRQKSARYTHVISIWTQIGKPAVPSLIKALDHENGLVWRSAATALAQIDDPRAIEPLLQLAKRRLLLSSNKAVIAFLERHDSQRSRDALWDAVGKDKTWGGLYPAAGLARLKDKRAFEPLMAALMHRLPYVRQRAAQALGALGDARAFDALTTLLDQKALIPPQLIRGMYQVDATRTVRCLIDRFGNYAFGEGNPMPEYFSYIGSSEYTELLRALSAGQPWRQRRTAVSAIAKCGDRRAAIALTRRYFEERELRVRKHIPWTISDLRDPACIPILMKKLNEDERYIGVVAEVMQFTGHRGVAALIAYQPKSDATRLAIIYTLGVLGETEATPYLLGMVERRAFHDVTIRALARIGDPRAVPPLIKALPSLTFARRTEMIRALSRIGAPAVAGLILALDVPEVEPYAAATLARIGDGRAVGPLVKRLAARQGEKRTPLIEALGGLGHPDAVEALIEVLTSDKWTTNRVAAASSLWRIGDVRARTPLVRAIADDPSPKVKEAARYGLQWIPLSP